MEAARIPKPNVETRTNPLMALTGRIVDFELVVADPDPLGISGFAFATFLANLSTLGVYLEAESEALATEIICRVLKPAMAAESSVLSGRPS